MALSGKQDGLTFFARFIMMEAGEHEEVNSVYSMDINESLYCKHPLRFGAEGKFRILMVSDIHGGVG